MGPSASAPLTNDDLLDNDDASCMSKLPSSDQATLKPLSSLLNEDAESIYIGLLQLTGKIIDNFDLSLCERLVESKHLIDEIFVNFLFKSVFD